MQQILKAPIRTARGKGEVRITDTSPTRRTPDLHTVELEDGVDLKMGDQGTAEQGFPTTQGSSFELKIPDPRYVFQDLFLTVFDDQRFEVALDIPQVGTWHGYVKSTLQTRRLSRRTSPGTTTIKCYDGLASLGEDDTAINARSLDVRSFLVEAFGQANPDLPIVFYTDVSADTIEGNTIGFDKLRPIADNPRAYEPPQPNGPSGEQQEEGLEGETLRDQLADLANRLTAVAYQDVRQEAWALVDVAAIGAPVTGQRYDGSSWSSYTFPEQTITEDDARGDFEDTADALKTEPSLRAVCTEVRNWLSDPGFESTLNGDDLALWSFVNSPKRNSDGYVEIDDPDEVRQKVDFSKLSIYNQIDALRFNGQVESGDDPGFRVLINYGNGDTYDSIVRAISKNVLYLSKDPNGGHSEIDSIEVIFEGIVSNTVTVSFGELNLLNKLTDNSITSNGTDNKYQVIDTVCYLADGKARTTVEPDAGGFLTILTDDSEVPAKEWNSQRYDTSPYTRLARWRAINLLSLRPPPYERLETDLIGAYAPLGTRIEATKPGEDTTTTFIPRKGRTLRLGTEVAQTELSDIEIPDAVVDLIP